MLCDSFNSISAMELGNRGTAGVTNPPLIIKLGSFKLVLEINTCTVHAVIFDCNDLLYDDNIVDSLRTRLLHYTTIDDVAPVDRKYRREYTIFPNSQQHYYNNNSYLDISMILTMTIANKLFVFCVIGVCFRIIFINIRFIILLFSFNFSANARNVQHIIWTVASRKKIIVSITTAAVYRTLYYVYHGEPIVSGISKYTDIG